jgi:hypothetical protein
VVSLGKLQVVERAGDGEINVGVKSNGGASPSPYTGMKMGEKVTLNGRGCGWERNYGEALCSPALEGRGLIAKSNIHSGLGRVIF